MSRSIDSSSVRSSAIVDADTQFDLDLADVLDQFPDGAVRGAGGAAVGTTPVPAADEAPVAVAVVPLGDPWVVARTAAPTAAPGPAPGGEPGGAAPAPRRRPTPFGEVVAVANAAARHPVPPVTPVADPPATAFVVPTGAPADPAVDPPTAVDGAPMLPPTVVAAVPVAGAAGVATDAMARAVDPPTSVHSVFVTPPAGTPVVGASLPSAVVAGPAVGADRRTRRRARRRSRVVVALAGVLALALVGAGVGLAVATRDSGGGDEAAAAASPGQSVALPPADAAKPADDAADAADDAVPAPAPDAPAVDPADLQQAADTVTSFLSVRGTDAERAVSSQGGRDQVDAALAASGATSAQGAPECTAGDVTGTFACVLDTDGGPITFTVGPDADDPASSGFEVIGASA